MTECSHPSTAQNARHGSFTRRQVILVGTTLANGSGSSTRSERADIETYLLVTPNFTLRCSSTRSERADIETPGSMPSDMLAVRSSTRSERADIETADTSYYLSDGQEQQHTIRKSGY